jgi:hypothetical protein
MIGFCRGLYGSAMAFRILLLRRKYENVRAVLMTKLDRRDKHE